MLNVRAIGQQTRLRQNMLLGQVDITAVLLRRLGLLVNPAAQATPVPQEELVRDVDDGVETEFRRLLVGGPEGPVARRASTIARIAPRSDVLAMAANCLRRRARRIR